MSALLEAGHFGRFEIVLSERRLHVDGQPAPLGSRAFDLLAALVTRRDRVVPKDELIDVVWPGLVVEENNLQVQISALRKVLGAQAIATVPGRGYQFTVAPGVPSAPASAPSAASSRAAVAEARAGVPFGHASVVAPARSRLLVADDNKVNRLLLCRSLELMGHDVASVDNGRAALERLRSQHVDLLLLDLEMPELDGFGLLGLRAADPALREVPVIVTSSLEGAAAVARCIELGADDYLHKPVNPVLLKARVDSSLERKHLRDRERALLARLAADRSHAARTSGEAAAAQRVEATLLAARLRGVAALAATQPPHETLEWLSSWTTLMVDAIEAHGGRVEQIGGDAVLAVFGVPSPLPDEGGAPWAAARAAREMVDLTTQFGAERGATGKATAVSGSGTGIDSWIGIGIGIGSGEVVAGDAGTPRRAALVCVGATVDRAVRLSALAAERAGHAVVVDAATQAALAGRVPTEALAAVVLPGCMQAEAVHALTKTA